MSALAAILEHDGPLAEPGAILRMLEAQRRRGPDAAGIWCADNVAIGHGLLATTPEDDLGPHPFCSEDGSLILALDGRLDNRAEVAAAAAVVERGATDASLVAAAYRRWGEAFARQLIGDFAIVLWDARRRTLVCARDPLGARPLYYTSDRAFCCASSPWALFAGSERAPAPSFDAMALFLAERYVERQRTLFQGVVALEPGATLRVSAGAVSVSPPWWPGPPGAPSSRGPRQYAEELRSTLEEAVRCRLRARGRVAVHVSGGLDSSSVACIAARLSRDADAPAPLLVRCVFPDLPCDESAFSGAVAAQLGLPILSVEMPGDLAELSPQPERVARGTFYNPVSFMLTRMIDAALESGARVTLTGAGSDQFLQPTGYELADALRRKDVRAAAALSGALAAPFSVAPYATLLREGVRRALPDRVRSALRAVRGRGDGLPAWMTSAARQAVRASSARVAASSDGASASLSQRWLVNAITGHADYAHSLLLADQIAASKGADLRHPFFDRRVIDLLLGYPALVRAEAPPNKALLRRAMSADLPAVVRDRTSAAEFSPFLSRVLADAHGDRVASLLRGGRLAEAGLIEPGAAAALVDGARAGAPVLRDLAALTSLELWLRQVRP